MRCPNCNRTNPPEAMLCMTCGYQLRASARSEGGARAKRRKKSTFRAVTGALLALVLWIASLSLLGYGAYKAYYWIKSESLARSYENGELKMPTLEAIEMSDGRAGHALTFPGVDGETIFIEELRRTYLVVGGEARVEIADGDWFSSDPAGISGADIVLTPIRTDKYGAKTMLPAMSFSIAVPQSPLTVIQPAAEREVVLTSVYELKLTVSPGSSVLVDGEDVSDMISSVGELSVNVSIYPVGDNVISILVRTPNHVETRRDVVIYREKMDIEMDIDTSVASKSVNPTMTVRGTVEPGATIVVDSPFVEGSVSVDGEGNYSFKAQFDTIGYNIVRFHAVMPGRSDAALSIRVYYLPTITDYSNKAWKMAYDQLTKTYVQWQGRIFLAQGQVTAVLSLDPQILLLDVGTQNEYQPLVIENLTGVSITESGGTYKFYADVDGLYEVGGKKYVKLIARYGGAVE